MNESVIMSPLETGTRRRDASMKVCERKNPYQTVNGNHHTETISANEDFLIDPTPAAGQEVPE